MKKSILLAIMAAYLTLPNNLLAMVQTGFCSQQYQQGDVTQCEQVSPITNCSMLGTQTYYVSSAGGCFLLQNCEICDTGFQQVQKTVSFCTNTVKYTTCECNCSNCTSDTDWSAGNTGYQKKVTRTCSCASGTATCVATTSYRCAAGYYGTSSNGTSGCTKCPNSGNSSNGSTSITSCCMPSGSSFSDTTGTGSFTAQCCYTN